MNWQKSLDVKHIVKPTIQIGISTKVTLLNRLQGDWIFYIDPDERLPDELLREIQNIVDSDFDENGYTLARRNYFFGHWLKNGGQYPDYQLRLFKRDKGKFENKHVHEKLQITGKIGRLKNDMIHHTYINISEYISRFDFYTSFEADFLYQNNITLSVFNNFMFLLYKPFNRFIRRYVLKLGFRDGIPGFFAAAFDALNWVTRYLKLWELKHGKNILNSNEQEEQIN